MLVGCAAPSPSCLSLSRRVLGKRELCFRDADVKRIKAYERQLNETATAEKRTQIWERRTRTAGRAGADAGGASLILRPERTRKKGELQSERRRRRPLLCLRSLCSSPPTPPPLLCLSPFSFSSPTRDGRTAVAARASPRRGRGRFCCCAVIGRKVGAINIARI